MKYADDIVSIMNDRGNIKIPKDCTTSEEFDKWMHRANQGDERGGRMTIEQAKSELMQIYGALSPNKQIAIDTLVKIQTCDDAVSRQVVFEQIGGWIASGEHEFTNATDYLTKRIKDISPVTPQPKTGRRERSEE